MNGIPETKRLDVAPNVNRSILINQEKENEEWHDVVGWEGLYLVSNMGRVKSLERKVKTCGTKRNYTIRTVKEHILKRSIDKTGYYRVDLTINDKKENSLVHRLVAKAFIENPKNKPEVNHKNGIKTDSMVCNLEWATHKENMAHSFETGLTPYRELGKGENAISAKLNNSQVIEIKTRLCNETVKQIAKDFAFICESTISEIKAGRSWAHIVLPHPEDRYRIAMGVKR